MIVFLLFLAGTNLYFSCSVDPENNRPGNESFKIIGIFSYCNSNSLSKILMPNDVFYQKANICKNSIDWVVNNRDKESSKSKQFQNKYSYVARWNLDDVEYIPFYTCTIEDAVKLSTEVLLNPIFFVSDKYQKNPKWRESLIRSWSGISKVLAVILYTSNLITEQLLHTLSISSFPIYHMDSNWKLPDIYRSKYFNSKKKCTILLLITMFKSTK